MAKSITPLNDATQRLLTRDFWKFKPDARTVKVLIEVGADIEAINEYGRSPLHLAARYGTAEGVTALIDAGADIEARDDDGASPADLARDNPHLDGTEVRKLLA